MHEGVIDWEQHGEGGAYKSHWTAYSDAGAKYTITLRVRRFVGRYNDKNLIVHDLADPSEFYSTYERALEEIPILGNPARDDGIHWEEHRYPVPETLLDPYWDDMLQAWVYPTDTDWIFLLFETYAVMREYNRTGSYIGSEVHTFEQAENIVRADWDRVYF